MQCTHLQEDDEHETKKDRRLQLLSERRFFRQYRKGLKYGIWEFAVGEFKRNCEQLLTWLRIPIIPATHSERKRPSVGAKRRWALI
jgi:hypothetical protein